MLCIPYFLLLLGVSLCEVLELVASSSISPTSSKTESIYIFCCVFEFEGFTDSSFGRSHPSPSLLLYLLLFLGFYSLYFIELVLSFSKSPSLLKSEFVCKRYCVFRMKGFAVFVRSV